MQPWTRRTASFLGGTLLIACAWGWILATGDAIAADAKPVEQTDPELKAFVNVTHIHGLPVNEARRRFDSSDVPALVAMLKSPDSAPYRFNVVLMLGVVGNETATAALIDFMKSAPSREVSHAHFLALATVPHALGFRAHDGDQQALQYLVDHASPEAWQAAAWRTPGLEADYQPHYLTKLTIWGLSVATSAEANNALKSLQGELDAARLPQHYRNDLRAAFDRAQEIEANGIDAHFNNAG